MSKIAPILYWAAHAPSTQLAVEAIDRELAPLREVLKLVYPADQLDSEWCDCSCDRGVHIDELGVQHTHYIIDHEPVTVTDASDASSSRS